MGFAGAGFKDEKLEGATEGSEFRRNLKYFKNKSLMLCEVAQRFVIRCLYIMTTTDMSFPATVFTTRSSSCNKKSLLIITSKFKFHL